VDVIIKAMLRRYPGMLEHRVDGKTPLMCVHSATGTGTSQFIAKYKALVEAGADVSQVSHVSKLATVLNAPQYTIAEKRAVMRMFSDIGADITVCNGRGMTLLMSLVCERVDYVEMPDSDTRILCHDIINHVLSRPLASATDNGASSTGTGTGTGGGNAEPEPSSRASALSSSSRPMPERTADRKRHKSTQ
jgi:hypothetical protein